MELVEKSTAIAKQLDSARWDDDQEGDSKLV
jgi:hypothetical protein